MMPDETASDRNADWMKFIGDLRHSVKLAAKSAGKTEEEAQKLQWDFFNLRKEEHNRAKLCALAVQFCKEKGLPEPSLPTFKTEEKKKTKANLAFGQFTDLLQMADHFIQLQPIYYDSNRIWWLWNSERNCWEQTDETDIMNELDEALQSGSVTIRMKNDIIEALRRRARKAKPKQLEGHYVQFKNVIVNVQTGEQSAASPSYFATNPIPHMLGESEDTPNIDKLFKDWVVGGEQDESYITTLYQIFAYSMLGDQFMQRLVAFTGTGSNGKGCCLQMLIKFIGKHNICSTELAALANGRFETSGLYKKLVAVMGEADAFDLKNTNLIKQLSGQDLIKYEFKGKTPFTEDSSTTCIISTNSLPITPDNSDGFYRRWLVIEFPHQFNIGGNVLANVPDSEYENLARKCLRIAKDLYQTKSFANEGSVQERKQKYEERSNPLSKFMETYCEDSGGDFIPFPAFYPIFSKYLIHQRLRAMSKRSLSKALRLESYVLKNATYKKADGTSSTVLAIQDIKFKLQLFAENIENIENINFSNRFYIGTDLKNRYFRYFGYLDQKMDSEKQELIELIPTPTEEFVSQNTILDDMIPTMKSDFSEKLREKHTMSIADGTSVAHGEIHQKCHYCDLTPCSSYNKRGQPVCEFCVQSLSSGVLD